MLFSSEIDLTEIETLRDSFSKADRPTYTAFIAKAIAVALLDFPYANRRLLNFFGILFTSFFQSFKNVDVALAIERSVQDYDK